MLYMTGTGGLKIVILETGNLEELKKGRPATSPDGSVLIAWTADPVWLADRILDSGGDAAKIAALIEEAAKPPEKPGKRPHHGPYIKSFLGSQAND